jgi:hypothetical protein
MCLCVYIFVFCLFAFLRERESENLKEKYPPCSPVASTAFYSLAAAASLEQTAVA